MIHFLRNHSRFFNLSRYLTELSRVVECDILSAYLAPYFPTAYISNYSPQSNTLIYSHVYHNICNSWNALFYKRHSVILRISSWKTLLHIILPIEKSQSIQIFQKSIQFLTKSSTGWDNPSVIYVLLYCNVWALLYDKVKTQNKNLKLPIP